jgi:MoaA/NifB/PqqE/SkfB family radical SAM enzyme
LTCNIWNKNNDNDELTADEYGTVFRGFKKPPLELILTGGEPFIREDMADICKRAIEYLKPKIIVIPTNGILTGKICEDIEKILDSSVKTHIVVNVSLDGVKKDNDLIRGREDSFERAIGTYSALRKIRNRLLSVKIHTVISSYNVDKIMETYKYVREELKTNLYIVEIAQGRSELYNRIIERTITPSLQKYSRVINLLSKQLVKEKFSGLSGIIQAFRLEYYRLSQRILEAQKKIIPCYAGFASAQIMPNGDICFCATQADTIGNLRESGYSFEKIWLSDRAKNARARSKKSTCYCVLANMAYINMLHDAGSLFRIILRSRKFGHEVS